MSSAGRLLRETVATIGREYVETPSLPLEGTEEIRAQFAELSAVNHRLFERIPFHIEFTEVDPYRSAQEMRQEAVNTGNLRIYTGWSGHPYLTWEDNNVGRAVHDVWAHCVCGCPFTFRGEYSAYLEQRSHYPPHLWSLLFAEIPAQTAANAHVGWTYDYPQRAFAAPAAWQRMCVGLAGDYARHAIVQRKEVEPCPSIPAFGAVL